MKFFILSAIILLFGFTNLYASNFPADSIGMEKVDGRVYVLHQVEQKETLYSLAQRYGVKIAAITAVNPDSENGLSIGQVLRIPVETEIPVKDGRVVHKVSPKETLYSIARDYNVSVDDIKKWNKMSMNLLDIGQELVIYPAGEKTDQPSVPERNSGEVVNVETHVVQTGETLYSISRKYGASLENLRDWNSLQYNDISIGQELIVSKSTETKRAEIEAPAEPVLVATAGESPDSTESPKEQEPESIPNEQTASVSQDNSENEAVASNDVVYNMEEKKPFERENTNFEEVEEDGLAELIDGSGNNRKYLALHRTAPVGTIMRVRNEMNGQEVFVRIIGKLPDTGVNRNVLLKISKAAYEQLGAIDNRFRVKISFIP